MIIVFTTTANSEEAERLSTGIVESRLGACVQILPPMTSIYFWEGEMRKESENLLLIKTSKGKYDELEKYILANHTYDVPEIVAISAEKVSAGYLSWMKDYLD
jgi:periplasmic divalent cation tolerance protein